MAKESTETVVELPPKLAHIPAFPPVAIRVLNLMADNEEVEIKQLLELLVVDPVFSAEILRAANSPMYGLKHQIDGVQHALVVLGLDRIKAITLTVATRFYLQDVLKIEVMRQCWRYSLACALLADELARACSIFQDRAYTAALLHDIGRLALLIGYPREYADLIATANEALSRGEDVGMLEEERRLFGIDHCEVGRLLAHKWNLPAEFSTIAGYHLDVPPGEQFDLLALVRLACRMAISLGFEIIHPPNFPTFEELVRQIPDSGRYRFPTDSERLRQSLQAKIDSYDITAVGSSDRDNAASQAPFSLSRSEPATAPPGDDAEEESVETPEPRSEAGVTGRPFRVRAVDIAVFVLSTILFGAIFTAVFSYFLKK